MASPRPYRDYWILFNIHTACMEDVGDLIRTSFEAMLFFFSPRSLSDHSQGEKGAVRYRVVNCVR